MELSDVLNDCLRCHKVGYETDSTHWHYCNDCVKVCVSCKTLKVLGAFNFDFKSAEYKRWKESNCTGHMNASGHLNECSSCMRAVLDSLQGSITKIGKPELQIKVSPAQLQLMLDALQGKPQTT